jgi:type I restriction enzyme S subunit
MELDELPDGWKQKLLSDSSVATLNPKKSEVSSLDARLEVTFVPMAAVDDGSGTIVRPEVRRLGEVKKGYTYFKERDVIFAKITPCMENGKSAIAHGLRNGIGFGSTEFHVVRAGPEARPEWLHLILRSQQVRDDAENAMHGAAGQQRVPIDFLEELEIPVPPLAEQRRIVARVELLTSRSQQLHELNISLVEDMTRLLRAEYKHITEGAPIKPFSDVAKLVRRWVKTKPDQNYPETGIRSFGKGTFHKPALTGEQLGNKRICRIKAGDLVFMNVFAWEGAIAVAQPEDDGRVASHRFMMHEVLPDQATAEYLCYYFLTEHGLEQIRGASPGSAGRNRTLGITKLEKIPVPVPPIEDQRRFAKLRKLHFQLQRLNQEAEAELASFTPALLAKAFQGEL